MTFLVFLVLIGMILVSFFGLAISSEIDDNTIKSPIQFIIGLLMAIFFLSEGLIIGMAIQLGHFL